MWWRKLSRQQKLRRAAVALWTTPLIMLFPLWLGYLFDPSLIWKAPEVFLLFFAMPLVGAAALYRWAARLPGD